MRTERYIGCGLVCDCGVTDVDQCLAGNDCNARTAQKGEQVVTKAHPLCGAGTSELKLPNSVVMAALEYYLNAKMFKGDANIEVRGLAPGAKNGFSNSVVDYTLTIQAPEPVVEPGAFGTVATLSVDALKS